MPIMRDTPPPLPADVVKELRATLAASYGHKLLNHEGRLVLAVRVPRDVPDRDRDLPLAADTVPDDEAAIARDVLLIGEDKMFRLDPVPLRDLVREKLQNDAPVSKEVRRGLQRDFGAALFNPSTRRDWCIAVRVPRGSYRECTPEDLVAMQKAVEAVFAQPKAASAGMCYIVADNDYRRAPVEEFVRTLRGEVPLRGLKINNYAVAGERSARTMASAGSFSGSPFGMLMTSAAQTDARMEENKRKRQAGPPAAPTPPAPPMPVVVEVPAPVMVAATPEPTPEPATDPVLALSAQLTQRGFEVLTDVADLGLALAAHQRDGKRLIVQRVPEATPETVKAFAARCAELEATAGVLLAEALAPGAWLEAAGTCVTVLPAAMAEALTL